MSAPSGGAGGGDMRRPRSTDGQVTGGAEGIHGNVPPPLIPMAPGKRSLIDPGFTQPGKPGKWTAGFPVTKKSCYLTIWQISLKNDSYLENWHFAK